MGRSSDSKYYDCPYCGELLPSRKTLRRHVGKTHREKVDDFTVRYSGGLAIPPQGMQEQPSIFRLPTKVASSGD